MSGRVAAADNTPGDTIDLSVEAQATRLHEELVSLISGSHFRLDLQPIQDVITGDRIGAEALARFPGSMPPAEWFRVAHAIGLGHDLELRVVHEVIERASNGLPGMIAVNVSPQVITDPRLVGLCRQLGNNRLMIEVTDQTSMPEFSTLRNRLDEIRSLGIRIATHVQQFDADALGTLMVAEPDVVKLSFGLTSALAAGRVDVTQARNFFARCRQHGIFIVAVGVEARAQLEILEQIGVDGYQGYITQGAGFDPVPRG